ncbi:DMT family transporter [Aliarcobacter butzleri]|uniref:Transporter n=1 Tax=Aliarcobacter butzleri L351 TaxID=1447259 RepID=A0A837J3B5_9BACT|nr:DMT family transporter [Aliarcobacter butzleri]KLD99844.1 transporter [Aliarcobacter butzleri L351]KLE12160.1 transporter [Aliarcobacter butzleri L350]MDN5046859.1 DMT family transporter [Aliarcobacter butzleri]MDN5059647.1 DMT family transporter [Aliarcobacter butzleri]MDN5110042.1 DMT family transporter [Aliarcobacter butzleri]
MSKNLNAHFIILIATFLVGGSFIVSQKLSGIIDPISITLLRFVIASLLLAPIVLFNQKYRKKVISTFKRAMIISFFYSIYFIGLFKSLEFTTALNTGTIFTLVPLLTALVFKQKISFNQYLIYLIGIIGTCMVIFKGNLELFLSLSLNKGDVIFIFSTFCMALYSISAKHFHRKDDELVVLVFMTLVGGIIWMSLALVLFDVPLDWQKISSKEFLYLGYLTVFATLVTSYLYQKATIVLGPKKVMAYVYLNPGAIAILLFVFEFKSINFWMLLGILISSIATLILLKKE